MSNNGILRQQGVGLIEVMIALVVLVIGILALGSLQLDLLQSGSDAKARTVATALAKERMEQFRAFANAGEFAAIVDGSAAAETHDNVSYTATWDETTDASGSFKEVEITVSWTDDVGNSREIKIEGIINSTPPIDSARLVANSDDPEAPVVTHKPGALPSVVAVPVVTISVAGTGTVKEATKPKPQTISLGQGTSTVLTRFDEIT